MAAAGRNDAEEQEEALFHSYTSAVYYVQSPSNTSHANSNDCCRNINESTFPSPFPIISHPTNASSQDVSRFMLSRYSSSRGSNNSFHHEKKISYDDDLHSHGTGNDHGHDPLHGEERDDDDDEDRSYGGGKINGNKWRKRKGCWRFFSFDTSSSFCWISIQVIWRLMVSFGAALLVFYATTKPPTPKMSIKIIGVPQFALGEGVDDSGVSTKILSCNSSLALAVDNKSQLFRLHVHLSKIEMSFGPLVFATSQGVELYAPSHASSIFKMYVGTRSKPMYGAGRSMQDMLESGKGLPLLIQLRLTSNFRVVGNLINPSFHHRAECALLLHHVYDKRHHTQAYNSSCMIALTK